MTQLLKLHEIREFADAKRIPDAAISKTIISAVRELREKEEIEPFVEQILYHPDSTPHGPTEAADILTTHVHVGGNKRFAGFVLKGRSWQKVRRNDVTPQFAKLRQIPGLEMIVLLAVGEIQDDARVDFAQTAQDGGYDWLIVDAQDCARLFIAYGKICPQDGTPYDEMGTCQHGHKLDEGISLRMDVREEATYEVVNLQDVSHGLAKRYKAIVLLDRHYPRDVIRAIISDVTEGLKSESYARSDLTREAWGNTPAHVVWLFVAHDYLDIQTANWRCRTAWIDNSLAEEWRPSALDGDEEFGDIEIAWNDDYHERREFYQQHSADKGEYLKVVQPIVGKMTAFGRDAVADFTAYQEGHLTESRLILQMQAREPVVSELYQHSGNVPFPPQDCGDYNEACHAVFADVDNMFMYYSERGLETWPKKNRDFLMRDTVERFFSDIRELEFEEKKLH